MKRFFIIFLVILLLISGYFIYDLSQQNKELKSLEKNDEVITQMQEQLSGMIEQFSGLQAENQELRETLSGTVDVLKTLQSDNEILQDDVDKYKKLILECKLNNKTGNTINIPASGVNNNLNTSIESQNITKEIGLIKQIYVDVNGNRKLEIDYVQIGGVNDCNGGVACIINENPKLRTFVVSNNVQIVMQTLSHTSNGDFNNNQIISFDYFKQKFNDTIQYNQYPHNYSNYFKAIPFRITIENNIITKIEEQYMS